MVHASNGTGTSKRSTNPHKSAITKFPIDPEDVGIFWYHHCSHLVETLQTLRGDYAGAASAGNDVALPVGTTHHSSPLRSVSYGRPLYANEQTLRGHQNMDQRTKV